MSVASHVSCTSHFVPRTVAALNSPLVSKLPLPSPHSLRDGGFLSFFLAAAEAEPRFGQLSVSVSVSVVSGLAPLVCVSLKRPS